MVKADKASEQGLWLLPTPPSPLPHTDTHIKGNLGGPEALGGGSCCHNQAGPGSHPSLWVRDSLLYQETLVNWAEAARKILPQLMLVLVCLRLPSPPQNTRHWAVPTRENLSQWVALPGFPLSKGWRLYFLDRGTMSPGLGNIFWPPGSTSRDQSEPSGTIRHPTSDQNNTIKTLKMKLSLEPQSIKAG